MSTCPTTPRVQRLLQMLLATGLVAGSLVAAPSRAEISIGNNPLYLVTGKANVLVVLDNSNSMDEAPNGAATGSNNAASKSEIARGVVRGLTDTYRNRVNLGLMAYRQNTPSSYHLHNSPYDVSYDPAHFNAGWTGARASATNKRFRTPNPTSAGHFIYYNVALPYYSSSNQGNAFCYSTSANAANDFKNGEVYPGGPWDSYRCFTTKTGTSNALPTWRNSTSEAAAGYGGVFYQGGFSPTDSDLAQGILDFGRFNTWNWVGTTWFGNDSPGRGYLHIPLAELGSSQATAIKNKLACNVPGDPAPCTSSGLRNAGLTPIEGTLLTALDYYKGGWNKADEGYTASCYPLPESCGKNFVVLLTDGLPSVNKSGTVLTNPTTALTEAAAAAAELKKQGIETYVIGFALPYGTDPDTLNQIAAAGGTDAAFKADDTASLQAAFSAIFEQIFKKSSAFGSVSQNTTSITTDSLIYQGRFDSTDWTGELMALRPKADGTMTEIWSSAAEGRIPAPADRKVFTLSPGVGGKAFKALADLSTNQLAALNTPACSATLTGDACALARLNWLRGDRSQEAPTGPLRMRSKVHGDVISSAPVYVKATNTVFVGGNDGILRAIDAATGNERFAYIPNAVFAKLHKLTQPSYAHEYFVDGELAVSTAFETPGKNILVGALGRGGKALFGLDVSTPAAFAAGHVLWEATHAELGLVLGRPVIVKLNSGVSAVIVGNGINSTSERAGLFIFNVETGALIRHLDTGAGSSTSSNGLASPRGWDSDGNGTVDVVYAGDLLGNVWKFDLSASNPVDWKIAHGTTSTPAPMFVATDTAGTRQPITGMIGLGLNLRKGDLNFGKRFIFFGTGRYLSTSDVTSKAVQSWYGLIDDGSAISGRSALRTRSIALEGEVSGMAARAFSTATAGDMAGKLGWVMDLSSPTSGALGERMLGEHKFFGTVLMAASITPSTDVCQPGGSGYLNAIDPFTGASLSQLFFDANNDLQFNNSDRLGTNALVIGSLSPNINLPSDAILIGNRMISSGTSGSTRSLSVSNPVRSGRIAWREIVNP